MSEFGDFDIDSKIIADERLQVTSVVGGCICCSNRNELLVSLQHIIAQNSGSPVYIETTGIGDPAGVLQSISAVLDTNVIINKVIVVYDTSQHGNNHSDCVLIEKQLMTADIIILKKTEEDIASINPTAQLMRAVDCDIDLNAALKGTTVCFAGSKETVNTDNYRSFAFKIDARILRDKFEQWLKSLPEDIIRLKGFVRFQSENGLFEVHYSRGNYRIKLFENTEWMDATLSIISHPISSNEILKGLNSCILARDVS
jgi:G3E family GTPase